MTEQEPKEAGDFPASAIAEALPLKVNVPDEVLYANVRACVEAGYPLIQEVLPHDGIACIVGGGPSAEDDLAQIRFRQQNGQTIFALNGAGLWLCEYGIVPDAVIVLDARPHNRRFIASLPRATRLYLACQCDPAVFKAGEGHEIVAWHVSLGGLSGVREMRRTVLIGVSTTVGMRAMHLIHVLGYREMHLFGYDSSYRDGASHAYDQFENVSNRIVECVVNGRAFVSTPTMIRQADDFQMIAEVLMAGGMTIHVHGDGLLPEVARAMNQLKDAA